jgi:hypothetical protein
MPQGFGLIPLVDVDRELSDAFGHMPADEMRPGFGLAPPSIVQRIRELSARSPAAFVEAEFFGGRGEQGCQVWDNGVSVLGPLRASDAINQALRRLGVLCDNHSDEFDALQLSRCRETRKWLTITP